MIFDWSRAYPHVAVTRPEPPEELAVVGVAAAGSEVGAAVAADVILTLMMSHKRESSFTFMINPAGFLMTKLALWTPMLLGAVSSTEMSAVCPGYVRGNVTNAGAFMASSE